MPSNRKPTLRARPRAPYLFKSTSQIEDSLSADTELDSRHLPRQEQLRESFVSSRCISQSPDSLASKTTAPSSQTKKKGGKEWNEIHRSCLEILGDADIDYQTLSAQMTQERKKAQHNLQQLQTENSQAKFTNRQLNMERRKALCEKQQCISKIQQLETDIAQLKQQLETANDQATEQMILQGIETELETVHGDLMGVATRMWKKIQEHQNKRFALDMPQSDVMQGAIWRESNGPFETLESSALPQLPLTSTFPLDNQQAISPMDQYADIS
ncbi:unnamed protein product [Penicillium salamii]|uniref:Uncharacterized protein n=1 Tax=Penicillium salamii TaxID=1612424 RepID=A0A9W4IWU8_9EURO|nr:unnamed protein product [Penicillium salamii]